MAEKNKTRTDGCDDESAGGFDSSLIVLGSASRQPVGTTESYPMAGPRSFVGEVRLALGRIFASAKEAPILSANLG